jgi:hypothetical protein
MDTKAYKQMTASLVLRDVQLDFLLCSKMDLHDSASHVRLRTRYQRNRPSWPAAVPLLLAQRFSLSFKHSRQGNVSIDGTRAHEGSARRCGCC